jgi:Holliday junction resolvasome RuvABC ATP-dependent DNA helicase subunit
MNLFAELVGQEEVKRKLNFYLESYNKTSTIPFLNFIGAKGLGKTKFVHEFGRGLLDTNKVKKPMLEINSSSIDSARQFFTQVFQPHVQDKEVVLFFDEAHCLPKDLSYALLSIFNTDNKKVKEYTAGEDVYTFDFTKQNFIFATSESDKIFAPLRDRLTTIEFADYSNDDLKKIFSLNVANVEFEDEALSLLSETSRGNARSCILRSKEVQTYCANYSVNKFTVDDARKLFYILGILPHGLNRIEWQILNILRSQGQCSLSMLAAKTGLSRTSIQRDHELYLIRKGFINIDILRGITSHGCKVLDNAKKSDTVFAT